MNQESFPSPSRDPRHALREHLQRRRSAQRVKAGPAEQQPATQKAALKLEQCVCERTAQLEIANQELEAFAYTVSHDLRAPVRHISDFAHCLYSEAGAALNPTCRGYLDRIVATANKMDQLIEALLRLSRLDRAELKLEPVNLEHLVDEVVEQLQPEIGTRRISWDKGPLPVVQADPALLRQVLVNLLANAVKFTRSRVPARIHIGCGGETQQETLIFIRDNGVGFDTRYAERLFGAFQRLQPQAEFEGIGIGLATVRRIIARHGGRTWAQGELNSGATFYFSLPTSPRQPGP